MTKPNKLTYSESRLLVLQFLKSVMGGYIPALGLENMLDEHVIEKEHCWIFFRSKEFADAPRIDPNDCNWGAFAIGLDGVCLQTYEFRDDPIRQAEYEQLVSDGIYKWRLQKERIALEVPPLGSAQKIPPGDEGAEFID
jgi:hypothetical protein